MIVSMFAMPAGALASSKKSTAKIMKTTVGVNLRDPNDYYNIVGHVKKGTQVLFTGTKKKSFYLVRTADGREGYVYKEYLTEYGAVNKSQVYYANTSCKVYKRASTKAKKVAKLKSGQYVLVYATQSGWAYVRTSSGKSGYMQLSNLSKL